MKKVLFFILLIGLSILCFVLLNTNNIQNNNNENLNIATIISANDSNQFASNSIDDLDFSSLNYQDSLKTYSASQITSNKFITTTFSNDSLEVSINDLAMDILLFEDMDAEVNTPYLVSGISGKIKSVISGEIGNSLDYPILLVLLEDGTVESINTKLGFEEGNFESNGPVESLSNIEKLVNVNITENNSTYHGIVAITKDNDLIDITIDMLN